MPEWIWASSTPVEAEVCAEVDTPLLERVEDVLFLTDGQMLLIAWWVCENDQRHGEDTRG